MLHHDSLFALANSEEAIGLVILKRSENGRLIWTVRVLSDHSASPMLHTTVPLSDILIKVTYMLAIPMSEIIEPLTLVSGSVSICTGADSTPQSIGISWSLIRALIIHLESLESLQRILINLGRRILSLDTKILYHLSLSVCGSRLELIRLKSEIITSWQELALRW